MVLTADRIRADVNRIVAAWALDVTGEPTNDQATKLANALSEYAGNVCSTIYQTRKLRDSLRGYLLQQANKKQAPR